MSILVPEPEIPLLFVIRTPEALTLRTRPMSPSAHCSIEPESTSETAYPSTYFSRLIPKEVTTISSSSFPVERITAKLSAAPVVTF